MATKVLILLSILAVTLTIHRASAGFYRDPSAIPKFVTPELKPEWERFHRMSCSHVGQRPFYLEADEYDEYVARYKRDLGCSVYDDSQNMEGPTEKAKTSPSPSQLKDIAEGEEEGGIDVPSEARSLISTLCCPEVSAALKRLPDILSAAQHSEDLQRQLSESRQEVFELKREKAEVESEVGALRWRERQLMDEVQKEKAEVESMVGALIRRERQLMDEVQREKAEVESMVGALRRREGQLMDEVARIERELESRIEHMELVKKRVDELMETQSKLMITAHKAKELLEIISTTLLQIKHP